MSQVVINLDAEEQLRLHRVAAAERRTEQKLCPEAIRQYLRAREPAPSRPLDNANPLFRMIGLVKKGPSDTSACHDPRPEDPS